MSFETMVALGFLVFGGGFVVTLLMSIMKMLGMVRNKDTALGKSILQIYQLPILFFILLAAFIFFVVIPNSNS